MFFIGFSDAIFRRLVLLMMSLCKFYPSIYNIYESAETRDIGTFLVLMNARLYGTFKPFTNDLIPQE